MHLISLVVILFGISSLNWMIIIYNMYGQKEMNDRINSSLKDIEILKRTLDLMIIAANGNDIPGVNGIPGVTGLDGVDRQYNNGITSVESNKIN